MLLFHEAHFENQGSRNSLEAGTPVEQEAMRAWL